MKILYLASEASPFIKTGGLADVAGSLPKALADKGNDVRVVLPLYSAIGEEYKDKMKKEREFYIDLGWRSQYVGVLSLEHEGVTHYFIDNEYYFNRNNIYGEFDDGERFIFFSKAIAMLLKEIDFKDAIVHANDWHTGLVPLYIKDFARGDDFYKTIKTVYTIHNLKYQGVFSPKILDNLAGLSTDYFHDEGIKFYDSVNFMKAGIVYCDILTTVSRTYAEEIKDPYFGEQLEGIIKKHENKLVGIVNGIDYELYNPLKDKNIVRNYSYRSMARKEVNKKALQALYNLPEKDVPIIGMVSRLVAMKGLDLVAHILDELLQEDIQIVVLGTGDMQYEEMFNYFQTKYPEKLASRIYFNNQEAHMIYAGADIFLMPSMAEPCGISQLISLRYGTIPVVRETGGLKDTIIPYNKHTREGNGFSFRNFNAHELLFTIKEALDLYENKINWKALMKRAMLSKNDWEQSSIEYLEIYNKLR